MSSSREKTKKKLYFRKVQKDKTLRHKKYIDNEKKKEYKRAIKNIIEGGMFTICSF